MTEPFKAGVAEAEITPPKDVGLLMSSANRLWAPFQSVRKPLQARVLAVQGSGCKAVIVSLDLLGLNGRALGGWDKFKRALTGATLGLRPWEVVVTCTHTHTSPESLALTSLYRTPAFRAWAKCLEERISDAIARALGAAKPCSLALISTQLRGFSLQRRIPTASGIRLSDGLQPIPPEWMDREPIDNRVRALVFAGEDGTPMATVAHAACHPVHEMCIPQVSPDFPGEFCSELASDHRFGFCMFLNGAAGDVNPPTVCGGAEAAIQHGRALAGAVADAADTRTPILASHLQFLRKSVSLPMRSLDGRASSRKCAAHLAALRIGSVAMLFLPGEIFVETGRRIERQSPFATTLVTSLSESTVGYVPTSRAFGEGGYEVGPGSWCLVQPAAEPLLVEASVALLQELRDVPCKPTASLAKPSMAI